MNVQGKPLLVLCPTARDRVHFARPEIRENYALEFRGTDEATHEPDFDALQFLRETIQQIQSQGAEFHGVVGIDDFPACMLAALVAEAFKFPSPSFESLFLCQHKYYSRLRQREAAPEAIPRFHVVDISGPLAPADIPIPFPIFVKPIKSYLSILARRLDSFQDLASARAQAPRRLGPVARMFDGLVGASALHGQYRAVPASALLLEEPLAGHQVTLDGFAYRGQVVLLGVVDSLFLPGTLSFARFEYPSRLPPRVQERMGDVAKRVIWHIGLDRTFFNIEFFYRQEDDSIWIIEINGRMASQFAPLYRMRHGIDLYAMQLDMLLGKDPGGETVWSPGETIGGVSASFVMRRFEDGRVMRVPSPEDLAKLQRRFPDAFIEVLVREGERLSDELQDDESYRYALVNLWAESWKDLQKKFDEAKKLLPFTFAPLGRVR
ncbi:MAG TPA: ATP-grasp domain-containing protein [Candidatus Acidoferrum sp.]|nr:ATP-grasp domain-containing protein [Candidatus Acidoferrum sp.]